MAMVDPLEIQELLSMPDHLRRTFQSIENLGRATAGEIANETKRARAVESAYLNQLTFQGRVLKERKGRRVFFSIPEHATKERWNDLFSQARRLPAELGRILADDLLVAFENRLNVLLKATIRKAES